MARDPRDAAVLDILRRRRLRLAHTPEGWRCLDERGRVLAAAGAHPDAADAIEAAEAAIVAGEDNRAERLAEIAIRALERGTHFVRPRRVPGQTPDDPDRLVWDIVTAGQPGQVVESGLSSARGALLRVAEPTGGGRPR